jgi:AraC family transcriptional regulator
VTPRIERIAQKKLVGKRLTMSLVNNKTGLLWQSLMPRRKEIAHKLNNDLISMQIYPASYFSAFNPNTEFEKWASVEVDRFEGWPTDLETFTLEGGLYAVFTYIGSSKDSSIFHFIFGTWLPNSVYELDNRPHFEVLGEKYKNNEPTSEEEIWIPVKEKP